jgi:hypothetical protein
VSTPKSITFIVVIGLCGMACTYFGTLAFCVILGITPNEELMRSFEGAGMYVLGAFTAVLVNTRSQPQETPTLQVHARTDSNLHSAADTNTNSTDSAAKPDTDPKPKPDTLTVSASTTPTS